MVDIGDDAGAAIFSKFGNSFDFGEHGTGFEIAVFFKIIKLFGVDLL